MTRRYDRDNDKSLDVGKLMHAERDAVLHTGCED